ncbi:MAG: hypothetical protein ACRC4M_05335 [Mycoplasma sp.]
MKSFYKVQAKGGHVGKDKYYLMDIYLEADSACEAAAMAKIMPRVKKNRKDSILNVYKITEEEYDKGILTNDTLPYYWCESIQEQREYIDEIKPFIFEENEPIKTKKEVGIKYKEHKSIKDIRNYKKFYKFNYKPELIFKF